MKIVVTGALGHIGSRLIRFLPSRFPGAEIIMVDNMSTQRFPSLFDLPENGRYRFIEADVAKTDLGEHIRGADGVVQLAAMTDAAGSFERREQLEKNNFMTTKRVADSCGEHGVALITPSSTSVYGTQKEVVDENCSQEDLKPQSPYAETKLREEELVAELAKQGLKTVALRLGTIFGTSPGMRFHTAINKFCWQSVMGVPLTIWKTAYDQRRPYLDLTDAVEVIAFFLEGGPFDGRVYNVVTKNATVREVVEKIRQHAPKLELSFVEERIMNQLSYDVRNTHLEELGYTIKGDMEQGVAETIALLRCSSSLLQST